MEQNVGQLERRKNRFSRKQRFKGVTFRDKVKSVDIRKKLGVNSIKAKVRKNDSLMVWTYADNERK